MAKIDFDDSIKKSDKNVLKEFKFEDHEDFIEELNKKGLAVKLHFFDGTYLKGVLIKCDSFNYFVARKKNILLLHKGNVKIVEPIIP